MVGLHTACAQFAVASVKTSVSAVTTGTRARMKFPPSPRWVAMRLVLESARAHGLQVRRAKVDEVFGVAEKLQPEPREDGEEGPDHRARGCDGAGSDPGDRSGAPVLSGAPVGPHHSNDRSTEPERQWDQNVLETGSERVADGGFLAQLARNTGEQDHREIGDYDVEQPWHANLENVSEERPTQPHTIKAQRNERPLRAKVGQQYETAGAERRHQAPSSACGPERRERTPTEDQHRRNQNVPEYAADDDGGRQHH